MVKFSYYRFLWTRILLILVIFQINRLLFYGYNTSYFQEITIEYYLKHIFFGSLRFDISGVFFVNALFIFLCAVPLPCFLKYSKAFRATTRWSFVLFNSIAILLDMVDIVYYPFSKFRLTSDVFNDFGAEGNLSQIFRKAILDNWELVMLFGLYIFILTKYSKIPVQKRQFWHLKKFIVGFILFLFIGGLTILGMRGTTVIADQPITVSNANKYVKIPTEIALVVNSIFSFIKTINDKGLNPVQFYEDPASIYSPIHNLKPIQSKVFSTLKNYNVVVIMLESFGAEYSNFYGKFLEENKLGYTPFLDSLYTASKVFIHSFSNGSLSFDAMPAVLAGIPRVGGHFVKSKYASNKITGLATLLQEQGYQTAFFHGASNGSMGFDAMANALGYQQYFGMDEYGGDHDYDGYWGTWDHKFFPYFGKTLSELKQPFLATLFSLSSHNPFVLPKEFEDKYSEGPLPIHKMINYTDDALKQFFANIKQEPWYQHTLFVITADHTSQVHYPQYSSSLGKFRVPIAFFTPDGRVAPEVVLDENIQQIDITPTILDYLGYEQPYLSFGFNVNDQSSREDRFCFNTLNGTYQIIKDSLFLQYSLAGDQVLGVYNFKKDKMLKNNLKQKLHNTPQYKIMLNKLKAITQQYHNRMNRGQLFYE